MLKVDNNIERPFNMLRQAQASNMAPKDRLSQGGTTNLVRNPLLCSLTA